MSQGQLVFSGAVKSQTAGCSPERLISKSSNSHLRDERFISERRLERPTGGPALQGWRTPVRVPATGATRGDVGDCVGQGRGCGCGGGMARRVPGCGRGVGLGGSVLPREPRRGILGGTLGGRCPATAAPRPVAVIRCREARASLRGAASHEAKGRGGADRVGPPTGWPRRRLLREIGDELVPGVEQFLLVDDVVAVEDGTALVPGQEHGDALGDAGADQVTGGGAAAIVEEAGRHPSGLARGAPRGAPAPDGDAVAVEDERAGGVAACPPSVQRVGDGGRDRENPPDQRLRARGREPDDAAGPIDLVPAEAEDLLLAPAGVVGEVEDVLPRGGQVGADGEVFGVLEEALAGGILAEAVGEAGHGVEPAPVDGERAHAVEGRGLPVDGAGGRPGGAPGELVLADLVRGERGGPRGAAEERGEMGGPAAGGADGPELPDLVVLEIGVAEISQGRPLGTERARKRRRYA